MKMTLDIPEKELLFIDVPEIYTNFKIEQYGYAGTYIMETDSNELNHWKTKLPNGNYEIIGFVTDVMALDKYNKPIEFFEDGMNISKNFILRKI